MSLKKIKVIKYGNDKKNSINVSLEQCSEINDTFVYLGKK